MGCQPESNRTVSPGWEATAQPIRFRGRRGHGRRTILGGSERGVPGGYLTTTWTTPAMSAVGTGTTSTSRPVWGATTIIPFPR